MSATRRNFHPILLNHMRKDPRIVVLTADLGYGMWTQIEKEFPDRFVNVGAAEQLLIGAGVGLALSGKISVCFSMPPFLLYRSAEFIRNYLNHEKIPVKLVGGGRNSDYEHQGFTHYAGDDIDILRIFPNIEAFWPNSSEEMERDVGKWLYNGKPSYLNLKR